VALELGPNCLQRLSTVAGKEFKYTGFTVFAISIEGLTLSPLNKLSAKYIICFKFQSASMGLKKIAKMLSECQTAWIWVRR